MTKPSVFYVGMFAVLIAGLWCIMHIGGTIQAPADLRGTWQVRWDTPIRLSAGSAPVSFESMTIEQSGLFVNVKLRLDNNNNGPTLEGRFHQEGPNQLIGSAQSRDGHWALDLQRSNDGRLRGRLISPAVRLFVAFKAVNDGTASPASEPADD